MNAATIHEMLRLNRSIGSEKLPVPGASERYVARTGSDTSVASARMAISDTRCSIPALTLSARRRRKRVSMTPQ